MTTREIAQSLAHAARQFPWLGITNERDLIDVVKWELGHEAILDNFQPYAGHQAMAVGPETILHIISGNTPHAGLQSLIRGLLLRSQNLCKIPSPGLPEIGLFREALPEELRALVEISNTLPDDWIANSAAIIVFGDDATVRHFRSLAREDQIFIAHGHKVSLGIVFSDESHESVAKAARDASLFDQQGCLSPHLFYIDETSGLNARQYAGLLAGEMEKFNRSEPRSKISPEESAAIADIRADYEFRAANGNPAAVWKSTTGTDWTVIYDTDPRFTPSVLNRVIFVKPLPRDAAKALSDIRPYLSTIAIWPVTGENAHRARELGATRICAIGQMQNPPFTWHQDGGQNIAPLVKWVDFEK